MTDYVAELLGEPGVAIGQERIRVRYSDGRTQELRLHDYPRLYAVPGLYELIVHERLRCRSPEHVAGMIAAAVDALGWKRSDARVIDMAAGNGISGEALAAAGLRPVLGTDIVPEAAVAVQRDRPGVYDEYRVLDLMALSSADRASLALLRANVLCCIAPVGAHVVPVPAFAAAASLLEPGGLVAYLHEPGTGRGDEVTADVLGPGATELARERYRHRDRIDGQGLEMEAVVWRLGRPTG